MWIKQILNFDAGKTALVNPENNYARIKKIIQEVEFGWSRLALIINGGVSFGDGTSDPNGQNSRGNIDGSWISFVSTGANQVLVHQLNRPIVGFLVVNKDATTDVWTGAASTNTQMTVNTTAAGVNVLIFVF